MLFIDISYSSLSPVERIFLCKNFSHRRISVFLRFSVDNFRRLCPLLLDGVQEVGRDLRRPPGHAVQELLSSSRLFLFLFFLFLLLLLLLLWSLRCCVFDARLSNVKRNFFFGRFAAQFPNQSFLFVLKKFFCVLNWLYLIGWADWFTLLV